METEYKTVLKESCIKLIEKKSEFISNVRPVATEDEAISFLKEMRSKYSNASHNVYAYILRENNLQRFSDDGEPSGTAGMPVLDAIRKRGIVDTAVVVTRYFGGTLLGTGGLVKAYGRCAVDGITASVPIIRRLCEIYSVKCDYTLLGKVQYEINSSPHILKDTKFDEFVSFYVCVEKGQGALFEKSMTDATNGRAIIEKGDFKYITVEI